jgi:hypothetical protein
VARLVHRAGHPRAAPRARPARPVPGARRLEGAGHRRAAPHHGDNLFAPLPGDRGARGPFDGEAHDRMRPGRQVLVALAALLSLGILAWRRSRTTR